MLTTEWQFLFDQLIFAELLQVWAFKMTSFVLGGTWIHVRVSMDW